jgi:hypothetical protein
MTFTKNNLKYVYRAHVLHRSMMVHYGTIYAVCVEIFQTCMKRSLVHHMVIVSQHEL